MTDKTENNVVFLAYSNPDLKPETISFLGCKTCRNKTYTVVYDSEPFPMLTCSVCSADCGRIGWAEK